MYIFILLEININLYMKRIMKTTIFFVFLLTLSIKAFAITKDAREECYEGGPTLTLINETSFKLSLKVDIGMLFSNLKHIPDLDPFSQHIETFDVNYGQKGTTFEVYSPEWPQDQKLIVKIPKPKGPNFAPFWNAENEIYGETIGIDYKIEWSAKDPVGWVVTFYEEEALTAYPEKGPSAKVEELRERNRLIKSDNSAGEKEL